MPGEQRQGVAAEFVETAVVEAVEDRLAERREVVQALAQRRDLDRQDVQPVVEVSAETAFAHRLLQVDGSGGDQADVAADHFVGTHRFELFLL